MIATPQQRFEAIAAQVADPVLRYALRRTDQHSAEDVVAETLLIVWRRLDAVPEGGELPWCYAVARNCLANVQRSARRQRSLAARIAAVDPPVETAAATDLPDPDLHRALACLREDDRELLRLWAWEDLTPTEIALVLGVSSNAVGIRLHRARGRLADALANTTGKDSTPGGQISDERGGTR